MGKLTAKRVRFCKEWVIDQNATQAALRAGYSKKTAYSLGPEVLKVPEAKAYILELQEEIRARSEVTFDNIISDLKQDRESARATNQSPAAIKATTEIAKLHGFYEAHNKQKANPADLTLDGVYDRIEEIKSKLDKDQNTKLN